MAADLGALYSLRGLLQLWVPRIHDVVAQNVDVTTYVTVWSSGGEDGLQATVSASSKIVPTRLVTHTPQPRVGLYFQL